MNTGKTLLVLFLGLLCCAGCTVSVVDWGIKMQSPVPADTTTYSDEDIDIHFVIDDKSINFDLKNKTQNGIKLNYDEISYMKYIYRKLKSD